MQADAKIYNPEYHDKYKALCVKQPYANAIAVGAKTIEVRSRKTNYRGPILICSSKNPYIPGLASGATLALCEIEDCKAVKDFTDEDWEKTHIPIKTRKTFSNGYGWILKNIRRVIEIPICGRLGIFDIVFDKGDINEYPKQIILDDKAFEKIKEDGKCTE